ncbi:MAG: 1-acyl-sn-glycerol-3-phosphate acyltransferase [Desulfohalobiaceae bacterium]
MRLYSILRNITRVAAHLYFVDIQSTGRENLPARVPLILAANHPGSLLDAVLLSAQVPRKINYLAKSDLFRYPFVSSLFNSLGVIPIYRPGHTGQYAQSNVHSFQKVYGVLQEQGCIGIFPEGRNSPHGQVGELRTGTARMALGAEAENGYQLGVGIVPVGLSFESRELLLSSVLLSFAQPIWAADYAEMHQEAPEQAVRALTSDLQQALRQQALHIEDLRLGQLVADLSAILEPEPTLQDSQPAAQNASASSKRISHWQRITAWFRPVARTEHDLRSALRTRQNTNLALSQIAAQAPEELEGLRKDVERYKDHLSQARLREDLSHDFQRPVQERLIRLRMTLYALLMAPFALFGFMHNIIPYLVTLFTARFFKEEPIRGFAYFALGVLFFSLSYLFYAGLFWHYAAPSPLWCLVYVAVLPCTGFACLRYRREITRYRDKILIRTFFQSKQHLREGLQQERQAIIASFQELRRLYVRKSQLAGSLD